MLAKKGIRLVPQGGAEQPQNVPSTPPRQFSNIPNNVSAPGIPSFSETPAAPKGPLALQQLPTTPVPPTLESAPEAQRTPVFIPSTGKKSTGTMRPPVGRRKIINIGALVALVLVVGTTMAVVLPIGNGHANTLLGSIFQPQSNMVTSQSQNTALIAAQAATATAVMQDGYDAGGNVTYDGVNRDYSLGNGQNTLNIASGGSAAVAPAGGQVSAASLVIRATPGQCTYWADYRYWQLTGYEVPWAGNAATYAWQAPSYGWINSSVPRIHSIIVLQPGVQNAGPYTGHVGIVEGINADGSLNVSSWNIVGPGILSYNTYYPGAGVSFVYHP